MCVFTASDFSGELIDLPEGRLEWVTNKELLSLNLWASDHIFMPWIHEGKFFSTKFEYEGDKRCTYHMVFHFSPQPFVAEKGELSDLSV